MKTELKYGPRMCNSSTCKQQIPGSLFDRTCLHLRWKEEEAERRKGVGTEAAGNEGKGAIAIAIEGGGRGGRGEGRRWIREEKGGGASLYHGT
jgi:hypothetical protein